MSKIVRQWSVWVGLALIVLAATWAFSAPKPKAANIELRASFRGLTNPSVTGYDFFVDKIFNDGQEPYVTTGDGLISVWLTSDTGQLDFHVYHHAVRRVNVVFPYFSGPCGFLPDTLGLYESLPDEPVDYFRFATNWGQGFAGPQLNFLTMTDGQTAQVRVWAQVCTAERHYFFPNYNNPNSTGYTALLQVTAYNIDPDPEVDRWVVQPIENTNDLVYITKLEGKGANQYYCSFGEHFMPFMLTLERVK